MPPLIKQAMTAESAQEKKAKEREKGGAEEYARRWREVEENAREREGAPKGRRIPFVQKPGS